ncbi:MAG: 3-isopropylmalate dehydratase large subunit [Gammaproteobacteria bacterium]|nr:3-isopropylmalate dehydratase large subunit [Gammaproteobacteria bacterium]
MARKTLYDKVWDAHAVKNYDDGTTLLYVDRHLVQEVSSPQAFAQLVAAERTVWRRDAHLCVADHAVPTTDRSKPIDDLQARAQISRLEENAARFGLTYVPFTDPRQGIVHVIGPESGFTEPGITLVCGDSHTCTHGAFGALAFGIGSTECGAVLATQCLRQTKAKNMRVWVEGEFAAGVGSKDLILALIARIGTSGASGCAVEFAGPTISGLTMEARMTLCNMVIEAGARVGMIAPDEATLAYVKGRRFSPSGDDWEIASAHWRTLYSDADAVFERTERFDVTTLQPQMSWGTSPEQTAAIGGTVPDPADIEDLEHAERLRATLAYMDLQPGMRLSDIAIDKVFIGSCTNGRIEDLRAAAAVARGRHVAPGVQALVVPGSGLVKLQAEQEGLDTLFKEAGFEWREPGCSLCVGMNTDRLAEGERCASTSNRNFQGRQGPGGRTHLMSPAMAAAAALTGHLSDGLDIGADEGKSTHAA